MMRILTLAFVVLGACELAHPAPARVTINLSALTAAQQLTPQDLTAVQVTSVCDSGASETQPVALDGAAQRFSGVFSACGATTISVAIQRNVATGDPITILSGQARALLAAHTAITLDIPAYLTGELDVDTPTPCTLTVTRTHPAGDGIVRTQVVSSSAQLVLPVGQYAYTCGAASGAFAIAFATRTPLTVGGSPNAPTLVKDTLPATLRSSDVVNATFAVTAVFSTAVVGVDQGGVTVSPPAVISNVTTVDNITWTYLITALQARASYEVQYTAAIRTSAGTSLAGAPVVEAFKVLPAQLYVSAAVGNTKNTGATPTDPLSTIYQALLMAQPGTDILVEAGTYEEPNPLTVSGSTHLLGGYFTTVTPFDSSDPYARVTQIESGAVTAPIVNMVGAGSMVDGFWLDDPMLGDDGTGSATCVHMDAGEMVLSNNFITCTATLGTAYAVRAEGAPVIVNNVIDGPIVNGGLAVGIDLLNGPATITSNTINGGYGGDENVPLMLEIDALAAITNNLFIANQGGSEAIYVNTIFPLSLQNNLFAGELEGHEVYWSAQQTDFSPSTNLPSLDHSATGVAGKTARVSGNSTTSSPAVALVSDPMQQQGGPASQPTSDYYPHMGTEADFNIGKETTGSDCGSYEAPLPCGGTDTDRAGRPRGVPPAAGAYEVPITLP